MLNGTGRAKLFSLRNGDGLGRSSLRRHALQLTGKLTSAVWL